MAQTHKLANVAEAKEDVSVDITSVRRVIHYGPDWADIIVIESQESGPVRKETPYHPDEHGPASCDAYQAWALPEHLRDES